MIEDQKSLKQKQKEIEDFFKKAFAAESARLVTEKNAYKVTSVVELKRKDQEPFYMARVEKLGPL
jgi:hypothetical protein